MKTNVNSLQALNNAKYVVELAEEYAEIFPCSGSKLALANARMLLGREENKTCLIYQPESGHGWSYRLPNGVGGLVFDRRDLTHLAKDYTLAATEDLIDPIFEEFGVYLYMLTTQS